MKNLDLFKKIKVIYTYMKQYHLKSKISHETFAKYVAPSLEVAIEYFSRLKKLSKKDLLNIYAVTD
jgi:hypothetical protein